VAEPLYAALEAVLAPVVRRSWPWTIVDDGHVPEEGGVVLAANHVSYLDPLWLAYLAYGRHRRVRFLALAEIFRPWPMGALLRNLGQIPVERGTASARDSLRAAVDALRHGECVGVFPEGGISRDFEPGPGRTGTVRMAQDAGVPVVPVGFWGGHRVLTPERPAQWRFWGVAQVVTVGLPMTVAPDEDAVAATDRVMGAVCEQVARARARYPQRPSGPEDTWWWRDPGTARLRSCREGPHGDGDGDGHGHVGAPEADGGSPA
jgi:1-acyl-sn-glycerol-3-phosphate acyltransferase